MAKEVRADYVKIVDGQKRRFVTLDGIEYPAEELAWFMTTGEWPKARILFKDGNPLNTRWANLVQESA